MRSLRYLSLPSLLWISLAPSLASAAPWKEKPEYLVEPAPVQSAKVDAADLNGDTFIDLVFANTSGTNGGADTSYLPQQAFSNDGTGMMTDVSVTIFGNAEYTGRAVKLRDIDYDGDIDIVLGTTWFNASKLFLNNGTNDFMFTQGVLPADNHSVGDVDVGDLDLDGDLDLVLSNWGDDTIQDGQADGPEAGGAVLVWLQDGDPGEFGGPGSGAFSDDKGNQPNLEIKFSWDLDLVDLDNDYELDLIIATKSPDRSVHAFHNDNGVFSVVSIDNVQGKGSVEVEPWDVNGDSFLDILTLQDGQGFRNRILTNNGNGGFVLDQNTWPMLENPAARDYMGAFIDHDSDQDADLVIGAIKLGQTLFPDRLMINEAGIYTQYQSGLPVPLDRQALEHVPNPLDASIGTYAIVLAHLDGDARIDLAMAQYDNAIKKKLFLAAEGSGEVQDDIQGPIFVNQESLPNPYNKGSEFTLRARVHDNKSPLMLHDFKEPAGFPYIESWEAAPGDPDMNPGTLSLPGQWYGEYLWRISFTFPDGADLWYRLCAIDRFDNKRCTAVTGPLVCGDCEPDSTSTTDPDPTTTTTTSDTETTLDSDVDSDTDSTTSADDGPAPTETVGPPDPSSSDGGDVTNTTTDPGQYDDDGCGCATTDAPARDIAASLALLGLLGLRRRRR